MPRLTTPRLVIRDWRESDAEALFALRESPQFMRYYDYAVGETLEECRKSIPVMNKHGEMLAIALREDDIPIGIIGLTDVNRGKHYKEIEYALADAHHRRGIMTEAVLRLLEYGFGELGVSVVAAAIPAENTPSRRLVEKCGFTYEGTLRGHGRDGGDRARYSILKNEWQNNRQ